MEVIENIFLDVTIDKESRNVYVNILEVCDWLQYQIEDILHPSNKELIKSSPKRYWQAKSRYDTLIELGMMLSDSGLIKTGEAIFEGINTLEDLGFTDE